MDEELDIPEEEGDPSVPTELLDLHTQLEEDDVTLEQFKAVFGE